jgi:cobalt-zinc-cadmium efflux system outer membrane protein
VSLRDPGSWCRALAAAMLAALAPEARGAEELALADAVERALAASAEVRAAEAEVRAAAEARRVAGRLLADNPELEAAAGRRDGTAEYDAALSQRLELWGQRGARADVADATLRAAEARRALRRGEILAEVRALFAGVRAARERAAVEAEAAQIAVDAERASVARERAGDVSRLEVNAARVASGRAVRERLVAEEGRADAEAALELALGVDPGALREVALVPGTPRTAVTPADEAALADQTMERRADVAAARADAEAARAASRLAGREAIPSPALGVAWAREEGEDVVQGTLAVELPLFRRNEVARADASARASTAEAQLAVLERRVRQEVRLAAGRVRSARAAVEALGDGAIAAVEENAALVERAHAEGRLGFVEVALLRRQLLDARRDRIDALERLARAEAELGRVTGEEPGR